MQFHLSFFGAAQNVTGSQYLLQANGKNILIDCGLYQEHDLKERNWADFKFPPAELDAVVLTHAHLDHCGLLPRLVAQGFSGPIYCTRATADIAQIVIRGATLGGIEMTRAMDACADADADARRIASSFIVSQSAAIDRQKAFLGG